MRNISLGCRPCCLKGKAKSVRPTIARLGGILRSRRAQHVRDWKASNRMHENRETSALAAAGQSGSGRGQTSKLSMNDGEESESAVVPMKEPNKGRPGRPAEVLEGSAGAKENRSEPTRKKGHRSDAERSN